MSFENWWMGELLPRRCLGALPQYYYGSMTPEELLYKIVYQLNELITNNNRIPEEIQAAIIEYINSDAFKTLIYRLTDPKYVSKTGDDMTGNLGLKGSSHIVFKDISGGTNRALLALSAQPSERAFMMLNANGKIQLNSLATPTTDEAAANKKYVDDKIAGLGNVLDFKGVKATVAELPARGNTVGDVWYVEATKSAWAWVKDTTDPNGRWDEFGPVIDLSPYLKKADIVQTTGTATDKVMSQKASTKSFVNKTGDDMTGNVRFPSNIGIVFSLSSTNWMIKGDNDNNLNIFPTDPNRGNFIDVRETAIKNLKDPVNVQDAATKNYVDAHSSTYTLPVATADNIGGVKGPVKTTNETEQVHVDGQGKMWVKPGGGGGSSYTLPVATNNDLGGVKAPPRTSNDNRQITIDADGYLWGEDIVPYELPVANYTRLGGIKAAVDVCPIPEKRIGICIEPNGLAWVHKVGYDPLTNIGLPTTFPNAKYETGYSITTYVPAVGDIIDITLKDVRVNLVISDTTGVNTVTAYLPASQTIKDTILASVVYKPTEKKISVKGWKLNGNAACTATDVIGDISINNIYRLK